MFIDRPPWGRGDADTELVREIVNKGRCGLEWQSG